LIDFKWDAGYDAKDVEMKNSPVEKNSQQKVHEM